MSHFSDLMSALARELGISYDVDDNHAMLELDEQLYDFYFEEAQNRLLLIAMVGDLGNAPSVPLQTLVYKLLLKAQFCFAETTGFTFGLSSDDEFISLQAMWNIETMSEQEFLELVEKFVQTARLWSHKLHAELESAGNQTLSSAPDFGAFNMIRG